jgi:hypothetical protein
MNRVHKLIDAYTKSATKASYLRTLNHDMELPRFVLAATLLAAFLADPIHRKYCEHAQTSSVHLGQL